MTDPSPPRAPSEPQAARPRPKRRKIAVACEECRGRKVRCDGVQPACGQCITRGEQCIYNGEPEKRRATQNYITSLEERIKLLERPIYAPGLSEALGHHKSTLTPTPGLSSSPVRMPNGHSPSLATPRRKSITTQAIHPGSRPSMTVHDDGVNAMMGAVDEEQTSQEFFGSSSAASFMRQIKTAVDKRIASPHQSPDTASPGRPRSSLMAIQKDKQTAFHDYVLPPRRTADSLMEVYWHYVFPLYPLVDSIRLQKEYLRIWTGDSGSSDENMMMCTFNVIFALACQLADFVVPEERETSATTFFSRAKDLLHFNLWDSGSASLIQCLLLMAQYLQSTDSAHQCWIVTGLAIRNAQSMGLHLPQTINQLANPQEQQLARKIWHGCVLMDRVISMTFGRPAMISKASYASVPLPDTIDEEYYASANGTDAIQPAGQPSIMAFYAKSLELYEILNDILLNLYQPITDDNSDDVHDLYFTIGSNKDELAIFELDRALTRWTRSLPAHLRGVSDPSPNAEIFYRQSVVLRARFLHVRMLLFRPILSKLCASRETTSSPLISLSDSFPQRVALQCSIICVNAARDVIELIYGNIPSDGTAGPLPAWWYNILYVYTAATVIIAGRLCPAIMSEITEVAITHFWNCALEILRKYQSYSNSARRCVAALEILYERAVSEVSPEAGDSQAQAQSALPESNTMGDFALGEGLNAGLLDGFDFSDFQDMSWLNSVPSHLY
ncbi:C6 transcription factor [Aspergillus venezuelensis]